MRSKTTVIFTGMRIIRLPLSCATKCCLCHKGIEYRERKSFQDGLGHAAAPKEVAFMAMRKDKITGLVGTAILHIAMLLILFFVFIHRPEVQAEGGVPVVLGEIDIASGNADPAISTQEETSSPPTSLGAAQ